MDLSIPVALLHVAAFSMGYFICKGLGFNEKTSRTVSIETGGCTFLPPRRSMTVVMPCSTASGAHVSAGRFWDSGGHGLHQSVPECRITGRMDFSPGRLNGWPVV